MPERFESKRTKPRGGNIAEAPFARALSDLAKSRGYPTQSALARGLGKINLQTDISTWYMAKSQPRPELFGALLRLLKPTDVELDELVGPWLENLAEKRIAMSRWRLDIRVSDNPLRLFFLNFSKNRRMTFNEISQLLHADLFQIYKWGIPIISEILEVAPQKLAMSPAEEEAFIESAAKSLENKLTSGKRIQHTLNGKRLRRMQVTLNCKTYNGQQAADELGVTREAIRLHRKPLGLPMIMTEEQLELVRANLKKNSV